MVTRARLVLAANVALLSACKPEIAGRPSLILSDRVIAVRSTPAEVEPSKAVAWDALFVGPEGDPDATILDWALCTQKKPLAVTGPISLECLVPSADVLVPLGTGQSATGTMPTDACRVFGPSPPVPEKDQPPLRPADPDTTGGYYQPVRVREPLESGDRYAVGMTRISCGIGGATQEQALDFAKRYRPNENPVLNDVVIAGSEISLGSTASVARGTSVTLRASWNVCPLQTSCGDGICSAGEDTTSCADDCTTPHGCTGSEPYVAYDPITRQVLDRREAMRVAWFATAGSFERDRTGRPESEADVTSSDNLWRAPDDARAVFIWVVLRDDRGGVGWQAFTVDVE